MEDLSVKFAQTVAQTTYDKLPEEAIIAAKQSVLDTIGVMLAATGSGEGVKDVIDATKEMGGTPECSVVGFGFKTNAVNASLANGALSHSIDFDNVHDDAFVHPSASVIPAALALGEKVHATGKDLISAVALGDDLHCRMGFAVYNKPENGNQNWMEAATFGTFAATAAAAKMLNLNEEQARAAFGLAFARTGGSKEFVIEPGALRGLYAMFPNMTGAISALLASHNVPGFTGTFNGEAGYYPMFYNNVYDITAFDGMGERFEGAGTSIKPWPCCRFTNTTVNAALNIQKKYQPAIADIEEIEIWYGFKAAERCVFPEEDRKSPPSIPGAKLSTPFSVAIALRDGKVNISSYTPEALKNPELLGLTAKMVIKRDETLVSKQYKTMHPGRVVVRMKDGTVYDETVSIVLGHPENRLTWTDLDDKFRNCASYACREYTTETLDKISSMVEHLEDLEDVGQLMDLLR